MARKIIIDKYQGNTHYSVHVVDSFGQEHHLGYLGLTHSISMEDIDKQPKETKVYNEEESQQALNKCLSEMYKKNSNPD